MSDHRRTVSRKAFVLPGWVLVGVGVVAFAAACWLAWIGVDAATGDDPSTAAGPTASESATSPATPSTIPTTAEPTPSPSDSVEPTPSEPTPTPTESTDAADRSSIAVSVLNASRTSGLAATAGQRVEAAGWSVGAVGNWRGYVAQNTVHYPAGFEAQARLLADDLGITAVAPLQNGMSGSRLTLLLIGPV